MHVPLNVKFRQMISYRYLRYSLRISGAIAPPTLLYGMHRNTVTFILTSETPATLKSQISHTGVLRFTKGNQIFPST
jgi:hypothetical protein